MMSRSDLLVADRPTLPTATNAAAATQPAPIPAQLVKAAQQKLDAAAEASEIAAGHAQADPTVVAAREKLEAAAERLNGLKAKFDASLQSDPQ